jgi:hypothetical protein
LNMRQHSNVSVETSISRTTSSHTNPNAAPGNNSLELDATSSISAQQQPRHASQRAHANKHNGSNNNNSSPPKQRLARHLWQKSTLRRDREVAHGRVRDDPMMVLQRPPSEISTTSSSHLSAASTLVSRFLPRKLPFEAPPPQDENLVPKEVPPPRQEEERLTAADFARRAPQAGYLFKKGARIAEYKRRFFVLQPSTYLYYFLSESDSKPRGCIDLERESVEFTLREEFPDGRCRFELQLGGSNDRISLEARSPEICREWQTALEKCTFSSLQSQVSALDQERNSLQTRLDEMERRLDEYRLVEQDRDGALQEARQWKNKYRDLDAALAVLTRVVWNRSDAATEAAGENAELVAELSTENDDVQEEKEADATDIASTILENGDGHVADDGASTTKADRCSTTGVQEEEKAVKRHSDVFHDDGSQSLVNSPKKQLHLAVPSDEMRQAIASQLLSKDQQLLCDVKLPDSNFGALSNACQTLKENLGLVEQEASGLQQDFDTVGVEKEKLSKRMLKAEKLLTKLWEENCTMRDGSLKLKKERKLLAKEVRRLSSTAKENQSANDLSQSSRPTRFLGSPEKRLLQELEQDLESMSCKYRGNGGGKGGAGNQKPRFQRSHSLSLPQQQTRTVPSRHDEGVEREIVTATSDAGSSVTTQGSLLYLQQLTSVFQPQLQRQPEDTIIVVSDTASSQLDQIRHCNSLLLEDDDGDDSAEEGQEETHDFEEDLISFVESDTEKEHVSSASLPSGPRSPLKPRALLLEDRFTSRDLDAASDVSSLCTSAKDHFAHLGGADMAPWRHNGMEFERQGEESQLEPDAATGETTQVSGTEVPTHEDEDDEEIVFDHSEAENPLKLLEQDTPRHSGGFTNDPFHGLGEQSHPHEEPHKYISLKDHGQATSRLECPLSKLSDPSCFRRPRCDMDGRVYHLTFYSRKIGIQFQKVAAPVRRQGRLSDVIAPEDGQDLSTGSHHNAMVNGFRKTVAELKTVASLTKRSRGGHGHDDTQQVQGKEASAWCNVASPKDAVLVCGLQGFDDAANHERPRIGARLVAFDGISLEVGQWTFEAVRKAIQARERPLTLSFRNDSLDQAHRDILAQAVAELGGPAEEDFTPLVSQEFTLQPLKDDWFHQASTSSSSRPRQVLSAPSKYGASLDASDAAYADFNEVRQSFNDHFSYGQASNVTPLHSNAHPHSNSEKSTRNFYSFSEAGASSVLSSAVAPLVANLLSGFSTGERRTDQFQPHYLRRKEPLRSRSSDEGLKQTLHEFRAGLL